MIRIPVLLAVAVLPLATGGCSDMRSALGLEKNAPDEFAVVARQPLSLPPDYNLRPPRDGGDYKGQQDIRARARGVVIGSANPTNDDPYANDPTKSPGESALLREAGAIDPEIRRRVKQETEQRAEESDDFLQQLMFWRHGESADLVNPNEEDRRLREARALGTATGPTGGAAVTDPSVYSPPQQPSPYGDALVPSSSPHGAPPPQQPSPYGGEPAGGRIDPYTGNRIGGPTGGAAIDPYTGQPAVGGGGAIGGTVTGGGAVDPYTGNPITPASSGFVDPYTGQSDGGGSPAIGTPAPNAAIDPYTGRPVLSGDY